MKKLDELLLELGISKVRLAKYLGVSRQMLYNYLALSSLEEWPKEKALKLLSLLDIDNEEEINSLSITGDYIMRVETRLNEGVRDSSNREVLADLKGLNKKDQDILSDIINILKEAERISRSPIDYFFGGLHLYNYANKKYEDDNLIENISKALKDKETLLYCCHCTGDDAYSKIKKNLKDKIKLIKVGDCINTW